MSLRVFSLGYVTLGVVLLLVSTAQAQLPQNRNQAMQQQQLLQRLQPVKTLGTLVAATADRLQLSNNQNQTIFVAIGPDTQVSVTGTAEQDYLKSGVTVEFLAEVAKGGTVKEKIDHLVIVSPTDDRPVGLFSPQSLEKKEEKGAKAEEENVNALARDPAIGDPAAAKGRKTGKNEGDLFGGAPATKPAKSSASPQLPGTFTVRGTIKLNKSGALTLAAGRGPTIKAELADGVTIDVDMADVRIAQADDKVTVNGYARQAQPNVVLAESIKIELANPLTGVKKRVTRPAKTPTPAVGKAKKGAEGESSPGEK
jgi:hypothetical protein